MSEIFERLSAPFPPEVVSWRAQALIGKKALALAYIDARDVMERLDEVVGPENWQDSYVETPKGRVICTLSIYGVSKSDGAGATDVEGDKGAISDAFKRAAVKWGIGRHLYSITSPWVECETTEKNGKHYFKAWTPTAEKQFAQLLQRNGGSLRQSQNGAVSSTASTIDESQFAILATLVEKSGADLKKICDLHSIASLNFLPADAFPILKRQLEVKMRKAAA